MECRGARVHSDSWTTTQGAYDTNSFNVDLFAWLFQVCACLICTPQAVFQGAIFVLKLRSSIKNTCK